MMNTKLERIAKRIAATNDMNVIESVIEGGSYSRNEAEKSIESIVNHSGNSQAKALLDEILNSSEKNASITAGTDDLIKRIKQIAKDNSTLLKALLAAALIAGSISAGAAENTMNSANDSNSSTVQQVQPSSQEQPIDKMCKYLEKYISEWAFSLDKGLRDINWNDKREVADRRGRIIDRFIVTLKKQSKARPNETLKDAFNLAVPRLNARYDRSLQKIVERSFEQYKLENPDAETTPCYLQDGEAN